VSEGKNRRVVKQPMHKFTKAGGEVFGGERHRSLREGNEKSKIMGGQGLAPGGPKTRDKTAWTVGGWKKGRRKGRPLRGEGRGRRGKGGEQSDMEEAK